MQTGLKPQQVKAEVTALWQEADSGAAFRAALAEKGYILCRGDRRDFVVVDPAGDEHSLARRIAGAKASEVRERLKGTDRDALPSVAEGRALANAWGETDSDAAAAVRWKEIDDRLKPFRTPHGEAAPAPEWWKTQQGFAEHQKREADWSGLEKAAREYGKAVKDVAHAGQYAYWQAVIGGKPRTEADKLHDLMWGEGKKEPEMER